MTTADATWKQFRGRPPPTIYRPHIPSVPLNPNAVSVLSQPAPVHCKEVQSPMVHREAQQPSAPLRPHLLAVSVQSPTTGVLCRDGGF